MTSRVILGGRTEKRVALVCRGQAARLPTSFCNFFFLEKKKLTVPLGKGFCKAFVEKLTLPLGKGFCKAFVEKLTVPLGKGFCKAFVEKQTVLPRQRVLQGFCRKANRPPLAKGFAKLL